MKAAICYEQGQPLRVEEITLDPPQSGEVKVRIKATAICHSDIHAINGDWEANLPVLLGHEAAGVVEELGPGVRNITVGEPVVVSLLRSCGQCYYCHTDQVHHCDGAFALQKESRLHNQQGGAINLGIRTGAFAEAVVVDQSQLVAIPQDMPFDRAALLACGVITGVGAVVNTAQVKPGSSVVVIGTGGVGLNAVQGAIISGASQVIAIDLVEKKLTMARIFGATSTINPGKEDVARTVRELTHGRGVDYVFVTAGSVSAVQQGYTLLRRAGTLVIVGMPPSGTLVPLPVGDIAEYGYRILGSFVGATAIQRDIPWLITLYRQGRLKLDELISARYSLDRINEAIEATERGEAVRNVIIW